MIQVKRILVPIDFSDAGGPALHRALDMSRELGAQIHLLHVVVLPGPAAVYPVFNMPPDTEKLYAAVREAHEQAFSQAVARLGGDADRVEKELRAGTSAAPEIVDYAAEHEIDLIVMGTHGRRGFRRFLLGSVTEEVLRSAPCPVLTLPPRLGDEPGPPRRVVAALDLSDLSAVVLRVAHEAAQTWGATLELAHVVTFPILPAYHEIAFGQPVLSDPARTTAAAIQAVEDLVQDAGLEPTPKIHVLEGTPAVELARLVEDTEDDLMVIGSHGHGPLEEALLGSTAEKVLRRANSAILTVRQGARQIV